MAPRKRLFASALILLAVLLSSLKIVDDYADDYTTEAITHAALTYATARAINALVSMVQTSNIQAGIGVVSGSVTIGELLDPVNDLVERFSGVMTLVLASLAGQKVLLLIASHKVFLVLIAAFGLAAIAVIQLGKTARFGVLIKIFLVLLFLRFALGMAVSLNSAVDLLFLDDATRQNDSEIVAFRQNLLSISQRDAVAAEEISRLQAEQRLLTAEIESQNRRLAELQQEKSPLTDSRSAAQARLRQAREKAGVLNYFNDEVVAARDAVTAHDAFIQPLDNDIAAVERELAAYRAESADLQRKINGEPVSLIDRVQQSSVGFWRSLDFDKLEARVADGIRSFMNLMAIYLLKTIIFPLAFFYALYLAIGKLWAIRF